MAPVKDKANGSPAAAPEESPVVAVLQKRLRNLRKRLRNAEEIQAKLDAGKALNPDQELALSAKAGILAAIEELEKMASGLKEALKEELTTAAADARKSALAEAEAAAAEKAQQQKGDAEYAAELEEAVTTAVAAAKQEAEAEKEAAIDAAVSKAVAAARAEVEAASAKAVAAAREEARAQALEEAAGKLVDLLYLGTTFDTVMPRSAFLGGIANYERSSALAYAQHFGVPLTEEDLTALVLLSHAVSIRLPINVPISHAEALQHCRELAAKLLSRSGDHLALPPGAPPTSPLTYAELADKLDAIKSLQLFPLVPPYPVPTMVPAAAPKPASPAPVPAVPAAEEAAAPAVPAAGAAAPRTVSPGASASSAELPTAEQAAASGQNLVSHFFGGNSAAAAAASGAEAAAPAAEAPEAAATPAAAEQAGETGGSEAEDARYPTIDQSDDALAAPPADALPQPGALSFAGDKSLGISAPLESGASGGSGAGDAAADGAAAGSADGMRSGRGGGRGGAWGGRAGGRGRGFYGGRGRTGDFVPRGGRGGEGGGYRQEGVYGGRGGYRGGRPQEGGYGGRGGEGSWGRGRGGRGGRGGQPAGPGPVPAAAPEQAPLL